MSVQRYPCESCGAQLEFEPGTSQLTCKYCGHTQAIPASMEEIRELDFHQFVELAKLDYEQEKTQVLHCNACGAEFSIGSYDASDACPFCGENVVVPTDTTTRIAPASLVPFQIKEREARDSYRKWIGSRFWAPNDLKKRAEAKSSLHGMYVPYWTYDSVTTTWYTGLRGEDYWVTETYTVNGETRTRQVRRTNWYPASGVVVVPFDDVLVLGTGRVPKKYTHLMQQWNLALLTPYEDSYLSGYQAMRYDIDLERGWDDAQGQMDPVIHSAICRDIGGDRQQVNSKKTQYDQVTFKHLLLPIYSGAYRYKGKVWRFFINGQTGQVAGEAPVSWIKVTIAVILGLALLALIFWLTNGQS